MSIVVLKNIRICQNEVTDTNRPPCYLHQKLIVSLVLAHSSQVEDYGWWLRVYVLGYVFPSIGVIVAEREHFRLPSKGCGVGGR